MADEIKMEGVSKKALKRAVRRLNEENRHLTEELVDVRKVNEELRMVKATQDAFTICRDSITKAQAVLKGEDTGGEDV